MNREPIGVPEVFQRAMSEFDWGDDDAPPGRARGRGCSWWVVPAALLALLFLSMEWIVTTYTEWLWFQELGFQSVWVKQWSVQVGSFILFFLVAALLLLGSWHLARRSANPSANAFDWLTNPMLARGFAWLVSAAALGLAYLFASAGASAWESLLRFWYAEAFGASDPIFGHDISFYLFELPLYEGLRGWLMGLLFMAMAGVAAIHAASEWPQVQRDVTRLFRRRALQQQLAALGALFFGLWAVGYWLDGYDLLFSPRGIIVGAGYTDLNATLPALRVQAGLMALVALSVGWNVFRRNLRLPAIAVGLWLLVGFLMAGVYPGIVQRYQVEPNELARERPYIEHNIRLTRLAFGLDKLETRSFEVGADLTEDDLVTNEAVLQNIRLWDYRPLLQTYNQLQALRPYYAFNEVDVDRYTLDDGTMRQVMLAGRELNKGALTSPSWINQKLEYTHGYGIVMNPVDEVRPEGLPEFWIRDLPPESTVSVEVTRPELYYGELTDDEVFVGSELEEFDYPSGDENVHASYAGTGGVPLESFLRRLAFAIRFGEFNVLLSDYITPETRVMYHRDIRERVQRITPFLSLDDDPYLVVAEGRLVWMLDGYTMSSNFPYATPEPDGRFNYIRNAAKITVDAYDGTVTYYLAAPEDPLVQAYSRAFPGLFQPLETMPPALLAHIRYPEDLYTAQMRQYLTYHMEDVQVFYNKEDLWEVPMELHEGENPVPVEPYYVISSLPGENVSESEFLLIQPYAPRGKNNMIAWLAARNDPPHYGELVVYELPKQELVFGPLQIESRIDQEPAISQQITLWSQRGSQVIRGNLLVIPLGESFLYVEPLYLQSENSALPELKRVIVANGSRIVMRETLAEALDALIEAAPAVDSIEATPPVTDTAGLEEEEPLPAPNSSATLDELIRAANQQFEAAEAAQRAGDWTAYGRELQALQQTLQQMESLSGGVLPDGTPTP